MTKKQDVLGVRKLTNFVILGALGLLLVFPVKAEKIRFFHNSPPLEGNLRGGLLEFLNSVSYEGQIKAAIYQFSDPIIVERLLSLIKNKKIQLQMVTDRDYHRYPEAYATIHQLYTEKLEEKDLTEEYVLFYFDKALFHPDLVKDILLERGLNVSKVVLKNARTTVLEKTKEWTASQKFHITKSYHLEYLKAFYELKKAGVQIVADVGLPLSHNKYFIVDKKRVWVGSYNITERCAKKNANQAVWVEDEKVAEFFIHDFNQMFFEKKFQKNKKRVSDEFPRVIDLGGGERIEIYFSPQDDIEWRLAELLDSAKKSIFFNTYVFTHESMGNLLINKFLGEEKLPMKFRKRVEENTDRKKIDFHLTESFKTPVYGVYNNLSLDDSHFLKLREYQLPVKICAYEGEHHNKLMVIDGDTQAGYVITGSYNFSDSSVDNDEVLIVIYSPEIARKYQSYVKENYRNAHPQYGDEEGYPAWGRLSRIPLAITEIMYNPKLKTIEKRSPQDIGEFVEVYNYGEEAQDLTGIKICTLQQDKPSLNERRCDELTTPLAEPLLAPHEFAIIIDRDLFDMKGAYADYYKEITKNASLVLTTHEGRVSLGDGLKNNVHVYLMHRDTYTVLDKYLGSQQTKPGQSVERIKKPVWGGDEIHFDLKEWRLNPQSSHSAGHPSWQ